MVRYKTGIKHTKIGRLSSE